MSCILLSLNLPQKKRDRESEKGKGTVIVIIRRGTGGVMELCTKRKKRRN